jgi:hypothetical protein
MKADCRNGIQAVGMILASCALAEATITEAYLERLGGVAGADTIQSFAWDVSSDGSVVTGRVLDKSGERVACVWPESGNIVLLKEVQYEKDGTMYMGGDGILATAVSGDGKLVAGIDQGHKPFWWMNGTYSNVDSGESTGTLESLGFVVALSADGDAATGQNGFPGSRAIYRRASVSSTSIAMKDGETGIWGSGTGLSADGSIAVGYGEHGDIEKAFRWSNNKVAWLGPFPFDGEEITPASTGADISEDGNHIVGRFTTDKGFLGFLWNVTDVTSEDGIPDTVHILEQSDAEYTFHGGNATGVSRNAEVVVGVDQTRFGARAVIWRKSEDYAVRDLQSMIYPNALVGFSPRNVTGISDDGNVIIGEGVNQLGQSEAFRIWLTGAWRGYPLLSDGVTANTGSYLGLVNIEDDPYIFVHELDAFVYWPEGSSPELGDWMYLLRP